MIDQPCEFGLWTESTCGLVQLGITRGGAGDDAPRGVSMAAVEQVTHANACHYPEEAAEVSPSPRSCRHRPLATQARPPRIVAWCGWNAGRPSAVLHIALRRLRKRDRTPRRGAGTRPLRATHQQVSTSRRSRRRRRRRSGRRSQRGERYAALIAVTLYRRVCDYNRLYRCAGDTMSRWSRTPRTGYRGLVDSLTGHAIPAVNNRFVCQQAEGASYLFCGTELNYRSLGG
jgi:hypothetical protein